MPLGAASPCVCASRVGGRRGNFGAADTGEGADASGVLTGSVVAAGAASSASAAPAELPSVECSSSSPSRWPFARFGKEPRKPDFANFSFKAMAVSSSIELEWVFFSCTPNSGKRSRMMPGLTSNSRANSLILIFFIEEDC
jgi:hypothetical protein